MLRWMQDEKWDDKLIIDIMVYDNPSVEMVERLVNKKGAKVAYRRLMEIFK